MAPGVKRHGQVDPQVLKTGMNKTPTLRLGLVGLGLDTYWAQFPTLRDKLVGYQARIRSRLEAEYGALVVDAGLADSPDKALAAAEQFASERVDLVLMYVSTYSLSSTVLPIAQRCGAPIVVLNLQPAPAMDYAAFNAIGDRGIMTGEWLGWCQACSLPEIACVFKRSRTVFRPVSGWLDDPVAWRELGGWLTAARVKKGMRDNRVGVLGHYYGGMLDVYSDLTQHASVFGCHFEMLEMDELAAIRAKLDVTAVSQARATLESTFAIEAACGENELDRAARTAAALLELVRRHRLGSMAYYHEGVAGDAGQDVVTSIIPGNTLLTANGVPVAGEYEVKNVQAMKILDLAGCGGSFSEFYATDFTDDVVLLGHDGPGHAAIAQDKVKLVPLRVYHGKPGQGLSIEMQVRQGPATLLSVVQDGEGKLSLLVAEGEAVPGPTLAIGNTNSRYRFPLGARRFLDAWSSAGPAHHCAIGTGHQAHWLAKLADLLGIACTRVC